MATSVAWSFTADPGIRGTANGQPSPVVIGGQVYLFLGGVAVLSSDGVTFAPVSPAFTVPVHGGSVSVVAAPGGYRMYYLGNNFVFTTATSSDGLLWTAGPAVPNAPANLSWLKVVALPGLAAGYRAYYNTSTVADGSIRSMFSSDGVTFIDEGVRLAPGQLGWSEPSVVSLGNLGWVMAMSTQGLRQGFSDVFLATSSDGLAWTADSAPILSSGQGTSSYYPGLVPTSGNSARLYYASNTGLRAYGNPVQPVSSGIVTRTASTSSRVVPLVAPAPPHRGVQGR